VHAFSGTLVAPQRLTGTSPPMSNTTPAIITRSAGFTQSWTPVAGTKMLLALTADNSTFTKIDGFVSCIGDDTGSLTIPASLLTNIPVTDSGFLELVRMAETDASNDDATILLEASTSVYGTATFK
jgi:hypothetical protein